MFCRQQSQTALGVITFHLLCYLLRDHLAGIQPRHRVGQSQAHSHGLSHSVVRMVLCPRALQVDQTWGRRQRGSESQPNPHALGEMARRGTPRGWGPAEGAPGCSCVLILGPGLCMAGAGHSHPGRHLWLGPEGHQSSGLAAPLEDHLQGSASIPQSPPRGSPPRVLPELWGGPSCPQVELPKVPVPLKVSVPMGSGRQSSSSLCLMQS